MKFFSLNNTILVFQLFFLCPIILGQITDFRVIDEFMNEIIE